MIEQANALFEKFMYAMKADETLKGVPKQFGLLPLVFSSHYEKQYKYC